jgi:hypothetical protein
LNFLSAAPFGNFGFCLRVLLERAPMGSISPYFSD